MEEEMDKEEMKKCLIDANIYEENLSDDLIVQYYKAIKNSETSLHDESQKDIAILNDAEKSLNESANELLEAITNSESVAPSTTKKYVSNGDDDDDDDSLDVFEENILQKTKPDIIQEERNNNNNNIRTDAKLKNSSKVIDVFLDINDFPIGFNDMPEKQTATKDVLKLLTHELKYINIQNSQEFLTANSETKIKMLQDYHRTTSKLQAYYASFSTNMAPIGKPITSIDHDLCTNPVISSLKEEEMQLSTETTYISRSGRLTKRKVYNEVDESIDDSFSTSKRIKNDDMWLSRNSAKGKASKSNTKRNESGEVNSNNNNKVVEKNPNRPQTRIKRTESPDSSQDSTTLTGFIDTFDEVKESVQKPRTYQGKTPSNEVIMAKSSLFKDTNISKGRAGALVSAGKDVAEKMRKEEEKQTKFTESLDLDLETLEDDDDETEKIDLVDDDVVFKRRVIPSLPSSRKPIHARKRGGGAGPEPLNITSKKANLNSTNDEDKASVVVVNGAAKKTQLIKRGANNNNADRGGPSGSGAPKSKKGATMTACPLCSLMFPQKEIEEHAATCGEDMFPQNSQHQRITCEICEKVVPFTTEYEVHVKECIAKRNSGALV